MGWSVWSSAAEAALADAYQFAGGALPDRGLVFGGGFFFLVRAVKLGGPKVRKARRNFADPREGDVFMYHDASIALLLDVRRRLKAVEGCA